MGDVNRELMDLMNDEVLLRDENWRKVTNEMKQGWSVPTDLNLSLYGHNDSAHNAPGARGYRPFMFG